MQQLPQCEELGQIDAQFELDYVCLDIRSFDQFPDRFLCTGSLHVELIPTYFGMHLGVFNVIQNVGALEQFRSHS